MADMDIQDLLAAASMTATGGLTQAALGGAQTIYGLAQLPRAKAEFERAKAAAPSLETPSQFYENYKNAYDATIAGMQSDAIQANLATSIQALQGAGGRALVGGLSQATAQSQIAQNQMLAQERQMRLAAGQQLAGAEERALGRKEARSQQEMAYANQAYQAALGNIGAGLGSMGEGLMYGLSAIKPKDNTGFQDDISKKRAKGDVVTYADTQNSVSPYADVPQRQFTKEEEKAIKEAQAGMDAGMFSMNPSRYAPEPIIPSDPTFKDYGNYLRYQDYKARQKYLDNPFKLKGFESGGMMTNGSFNHNTNPIDLVQNGEKVGEATGGEYIINPTQAKKIAKESSFARKLFEVFEKNARKNK